MHEERMGRESTARLVPEATFPPELKATLRKAVSHLRDVADMSQLRNLILSMVYLHSTQGLPLGSPTDEPADIARRLTDAAHQMDLRLPDIQQLEPTSLFELARVVGELITTAGAPEVFLLVSEEMSGGKRGEFFTPRPVISLLVDTLDIAPGSTVYDPTDRNGELLSIAARAVRAAAGEANTVFRSTALNSEFKAIASMNFELNSVRAEVDTATSNFLSGAPEAKPSYILANPPFNVAHRSAHTEGRWRYGDPPKNNDNYAYLQDIVERLAPGGRASVVMTNGALFSGREQHIRAEMIDDGCVEGLISLPAQLFRDTGIAVTIWLLRPPGSFVDRILFIDASDAGRMIDRTQRALDTTELEELANIVAEWRSGKSIDHYPIARSVPLPTVRAADYNLNPASYVTTERPAADSHMTKQMIRDSVRRIDSFHRDAKNSDTAVADLFARLGGIDISPPDQWLKTTLGAICEITPGATTSDDPNGTVPVVKPKNLATGYIIGPTDRVDTAEAERRSSYRIRSGDILCTRTGTVGRVALATPEQSDWIFGTGLIRIRPSAEVNPMYLTRYLSQSDIQNWFARNARGTTIQSINSRTLHTLPIQLPPLTDQITIGKVLHLLDEQILAHQRIQDATRELSAVLFPALLSGDVPDVRTNQFE
ncbi:N-6 DNA methylase [Nocardia sp. NPDC051321]|uniref:type I restriction-modification system subunit M/S n=1 Tax=Nocardia sp. NPDC051321 TaxID=3364323 RepID=UPI00379B55F6